MILTLAIFFIVLGVLVCFHEFGHFIMAKLWKVRVDEFGFGFPPRVFGIPFKGTVYSFNIIPLGGFVRIKGIAGEAIEEVDENAKPETLKEKRHDADSYASRSTFQKFTILLGGIIANCILAWILLSAALFIGVSTPISADDAQNSTIANQSHIIVTGVANGSSAEKAGIRVGDKITLRDEKAVHTYADVQTTSDTALGTVEKLRLVRKGVELDVAPVVEKRESAEGESYSGIGVSLSQVYTKKESLGGALVMGATETISGIGGVFRGLWELVQSVSLGKGTGGSLAGPIGIAQITGQAYDLGFSTLLQLMAILSINLAVFNLLPIPALDGGRFAFLIIETIRGKKVNERTEATIHSIGFILLLGIILLVTYHDIIRIFVK